MISDHEDAMICDLAETYHIYDYRRLPVTTLAVFVAGLRANSRTKMEINGTRVPNETLIMAMTYDKLSRWVWMNSKDGAKGVNPPKSLAELLTAEPKEKDVVSFDDGDEFDRAYQRITQGG